MNSFGQTVLFALFFLIFFQNISAQITEDYGFAANESTETRNIVETATLGDVHMVYALWSDRENSVLLLNDQGELQKEIELDTDSSTFFPRLHTYENNFFLIGYESPLPANSDSTTLKMRHWKIQEYDTDGNLLFQKSTLVNQSDIGLNYSRLTTGITADVVYLNHLSTAGAISSRYCTQVQETNLFDPVTFDISRGPFIIYQYDRLLDSFDSFVADSTFNSVTDVITRDSLVRMYSIKASNSSDGTFVHILENGLDTIISFVEPSVFALTGLCLYAESDEQYIYEVKASAFALTSPNMLDLILTKKNWDGSTVDTRNLAAKRAPFGKFSIQNGLQNDLFILSADVINRSPIQLRIERISKSDLSSIWSLDIGQDTFGLALTIVPVSDGCIVYGARKIGNTTTLIVTKIGENGLVQSQESFLMQRNFILGPNPVQDVLFLNKIPKNANAYWYDLQGRLVQQNRIHTTQLDVNLPKGQYILCIIDDSGKIVERRKLIKE